MERDEKLDPGVIAAVLSVSLLILCGLLTETATNIAFPTLMEEYGVDASSVQWLTTGKMLVVAMITPLSAFLKKRFVTKNVFIFSCLAFLIGCLLGTFAWNFDVLVAAAIIQGLGIGVALPMVFNIILEPVPPAKTGTMMGIASLITAMAPAVGPSVGGMLVSNFGWRMIFISLIPLLLLSFFLGVFSIRQVTETEKISFQWLDYFFLAAGFACFIFATSTASDAGWISVQVLGLLAASIICIVIFCLRCKKSETPLIDIRVFRCVPFSLSVLVLVFIQFICLGLGFLIPNYAQLVLGEEAFLAGCLLLPGCIIGAVLSPLSGRMLDRFGAKKPILSGNFCIILATVCFSIFALKLNIGSFILFYIFFAFGQGFSVGNTMTNGLKQLPPELNPDGNAVINTLQQLAGAIGTSIITTIVAASQAKFPDNMAAATAQGTQYSFYLLAVLAVVVICCSLGVFALSGKKKQA